MARPVRFGTAFAGAASWTAPHSNSRDRRSKASATAGRISSSRACRASSAARRGPNLPEDQKERVLGEIGATIAEVQRAPLGELACIEPRWDAFMTRQIAGCRARHEGLGLPQKFLDGFDDLLADAATLIPRDAPPVILTGEYIPENFLLSRDGDRWRLSGLFDFGDVMTGWGEYDLLGPSAFMTAGMPRRVEVCSKGSDTRMRISIRRCSGG